MGRRLRGRSRSPIRGSSRALLSCRASAHTRLQVAPTNFAEVLPPGGDLAQQITKDPYVLDFLALALALALDGDDFYVDLLFFHVEQLRYVVIELKTGKFKPEYLGQLGFHVALVDDKLRRPQHADTVGLLLVADKNDAVVRYSLGAHQTPIGVASYDLLSPSVRAALPSEADLAAALTTQTGSDPRVTQRAGEDEVDAGEELGPVVVLVEPRGDAVHERECGGIELFPLLRDAAEERCPVGFGSEYSRSGRILSGEAEDVVHEGRRSVELRESGHAEFVDELSEGFEQSDDGELPGLPGELGAHPRMRVNGVEHRSGSRTDRFGRFALQ
jgi:hypothetical protein